MRSFFRYIRLLYKRISEAIKDVGMGDFIFENKVKEELDKLPQNYLFIDGTRLIQDSTGYIVEVQFDSGRRGSISIVYNVAEGNNLVGYDYHFNEKVLPNSVTHINYINWLKDIAENILIPHYTEHMQRKRNKYL